MIRPFLIALQFLTRVPVNIHGKISDHTIGQSLLYYPVIGGLIGACLAAILIVLNGQTSSLLLAGLLLTFWVMITGALHLDGLADSADAWLGGLGNPERTLDIMKDPRCGTAAVTVLIIVLLLKFAALEFIVRQQQWEILIISSVVARTSLLPLFLTTVYVRKSGLGTLIAIHLPRLPAWIITISIFVTLPLFFGINLLVIFVLSILVWGFIRYMMIDRLSGMTGDTAGAMVEIIELVILLGACFWPITFLPITI